MLATETLIMGEKRAECPIKGENITRRWEDKDLGQLKFPECSSVSTYHSLSISNCLFLCLLKCVNLENGTLFRLGVSQHGLFANCREDTVRTVLNVQTHLTTLNVTNICQL